MRNRWVPRKLAADVGGATTIEYGLILAFIVFLLFAAVGGMAGETIRMWNHVSSESSKAHNGN
jgi:pilus assembly protein Flp/PilA